MPRAYVDVSKFRNPFNYPNLQLTGLGQQDPLRSSWPPGRSYVDTSRYLSPYIDYQFQDNTLFGLGADKPVRPPRGSRKPWTQRRGRPMGATPSIDAPLPKNLQAFIQTGAPMSTVRRDLGSALAQVPRVAWGLGAVVAGYVAYKAWKAA